MSVSPLGSLSNKKTCIPLLSGVVASLGARYLLGLGRSSSLISGIGVGGALFWGFNRGRKPLPKDLKVVTLNVGTNWSDWAIAQEHAGETIPENEQDRDEAYETAQKTMGQKLLALNADALLLQEWDGGGQEKTPRALKSLLQQDGYQIFQPVWGKRRPHTAIALKVDRFEGILEFHQWVDIGGRNYTDLAIVSATECGSGETICFVSGYVPGFNFLQLKLKDHGGSDQSDPILEGDRYCAAIQSAVSQLPNYPVIVGADFNSNEEILNGYSNRFPNLKSVGLRSLWSGEKTNVNGRDAGMLKEIRKVKNVPNEIDPETLREIDPEALREIDGFFYKDLKVVQKAHIPESFNTWATHGTDHMPVVATFQ